MEYVWYASYGSNILEERFLCYIKGTKFINNKKSEYGCLDQSLPIDSRSYIFNRGLYFTHNSLRWNGGGVAFLHKEKSNIKAFGKIYKITKEQFKDIFMQENGLNPYEDTLSIDFNILLQENSLLIKNSLYGLIIRVGDIDNIPVLTFTNNSIPKSYNCPSIEYLQTIINGIKSAHKVSNNFLADLFKVYDGFNNSKKCNNILNQIRIKSSI